MKSARGREGWQGFTHGISFMIRAGCSENSTDEFFIHPCEYE